MEGDVTLAEITAHMEEHYKPAIREELNEQISMLAHIEAHQEFIESPGYLSMHVAAGRKVRNRWHRMTRRPRNIVRAAWDEWKYGW